MHACTIRMVKMHTVCIVLVIIRCAYLVYILILYCIQAFINTVHIATAHTYYIPLDTHCEIMLYSYVHVYECCTTLAHHILEVYHVYT